MSFIDTVKDLFGYGPEDDMLDDDELEGLDSLEDTDVGKPPKAVASKMKQSNKIVNINATTQLEVVLVKPERFEDASGIADQLNNKRTVVLNLESTHKDVARRLIDFLSGVAYANNGQIKRVANSTFIITPFNVGIVGDLLDELESSGVYF